MLHELFSEEQNYITKEDRINTLLLKLLRTDEWYDLGVLEDEMYVSNTTLEKEFLESEKKKYVNFEETLASL